MSISSRSRGETLEIWFAARALREIISKTVSLFLAAGIVPKNPTLLSRSVFARDEIETPSSNTAPEVAFIFLAKALSRELLPAPFAPMIAVIDPASKLIERSLIIVSAE